MIKFIQIVLFVLLAFISGAHAQAELRETEFELQKVYVTGFDRYPPWGVYDEETQVFDTVFDDFIKIMGDKYNAKLYANFDKEYNERVREVRRGNIDLIFGIYHDSETYEGLEYVFPAVAGNPIAIIMLPERISEVKTIEDLKKLKGARHTGEEWSDYVNRQVEGFDMVKVDNSYDLYGKLFKGEVDYLFIGHYYGQIEAIKLGLEDKVSFSKNVMWNMPLFIGVSKVSSKRGFLRGVIQKISEAPNAKSKIQDAINAVIERYREENYGTVPPSYSIY